MQRFTREHLWVLELENGNMRVGISDVLARELGEVEEINLPSPDDGFTLGESLAEIIGTTATIDVYSPIDGIVVDCNENLQKHLDDLTSDPLEAWLVEMGEISEVDELLSESEYFDSLL